MLNVVRPLKKGKEERREGGEIVKENKPEHQAHEEASADSRTVGSYKSKSCIFNYDGELSLND